MISWFDASDYCQCKYGTELASITNNLENIDAFGSGEWHSNYGAMWIGFNDINTEGTWEWKDGTQSISYTYWKPGQPNNAGGQDCAVFQTSTAGDSGAYLTQEQASNYCSCKYGTSLASVMSESDSDDVFGDGTWYYDHGSMWIGLRDGDGPGNEGNYRWDNGNPFIYENWKSHEPNKWNNQDCVIIDNANGEWEDCGCEKYKTPAFVCNAKPNANEVFDNLLCDSNQWSVILGNWEFNDIDNHDCGVYQGSKSGNCLTWMGSADGTTPNGQDQNSVLTGCYVHNPWHDIKSVYALKDDSKRNSTVLTSNGGICKATNGDNNHEEYFTRSGVCVLSSLFLCFCTRINAKRKNIQKKNTHTKKKNS